jgi:hypothetical protein
MKTARRRRKAFLSVFVLVHLDLSLPLTCLRVNDTRKSQVKLLTLDKKCENARSIRGLPDCDVSCQRAGSNHGTTDLSDQICGVGGRHIFGSASRVG